MQIDLAPYLMGDPITASRRPPTAEERARLERNYQPKGYDLWTDQEEALLRRLHVRDWTFDAIGRVLGRPRHQCQRKAKHLGLPSRDPGLVGFKGWRRRRVA